MANLLRGAMNLLGGDSGGGGNGGHSLVGQKLDVSGQRIHVRSQIAQGGFATVYTCQDAASGAWYALKVQLANDEASVRMIQDEMRLLKQLRHPHIIRYFTSICSEARTASGAKEFILMTELCSGGSVIDLITSGQPLTLAQVANIFNAAVSSIAYLHSRSPPVTHRDIKVENLLFDSMGVVKLCDFGSATTEQKAPDDSWSAAQRTKLEEDFHRHTTPMYRAPEILDTYLNYPVGPLQDVWAAGCVLFYLCYRTHPFEDSAKLRIIYAKYAIPPDDQRYVPFRPLIECSLRPDPRERPSAADLLERIGALAAALQVRVDTPVPGIDPTILTGSEPAHQSTSTASGQAPAAASRAPIDDGLGGQQSQASAALSNLRGQGLSLFKNIKEKSAAVVQTVQNTYGSKGPELVWVTTRIVLAPQNEGVPEALAAQAEDTLRQALFATRRPFKMINLSTRRLRCEYPVSTADCTFPPDGSGLAPPMDAVLSVCHAAGVYLRQNPSDACVVLVGCEAHTALAALALLVYHRLMPKPWCAVELLQEKRMTPLLLPPSAHRTLDALHASVQPDFVQTITDSRLQLEALTVENLPTFNNARTGCRPMLMIYVGGTALSAPEPYETLRPYEGAERRRAQFGLKRTLVYGDVCIVLFHARMSTLSGRVQQIPMFSISLHTALTDARKTTSIVFRKGELDYVGADDALIPEDIRVTLAFSAASTAQPPRPPAPGGGPRSFLDYPGDIVAPRHVVSSPRELDEIQAKFESGRPQAPRQPQPPSDAISAQQRQQPSVQPSADFFGSLAWGGESSSATAAPPAPPPHRPKPPAPEIHERLESLRVETGGNERFVPTETPILGDSHSPSASLTDVQVEDDEVEADLLGIGSDTAPAAHSKKPAAAATSSTLLFDPFSTTSSSTTSTSAADLFGGAGAVTNNHATGLEDIFGAPLAPSSTASKGSGAAVASDMDLFGFGATSPPPVTSHSTGGDLLGDFFGGGVTPATTTANHATLNNISASSSMQRNSSAPSFSQRCQPFDPFAEFLATNPVPAASSSATSTRSSTPLHQQQQKANYSRSAFDGINPPPAVAKKTTTANAFDDILISQGFSSASSTGGGNKTIADMRRNDEIRDLTPEQIKIRDWTKGKERNIRALLASLHEVLWEDAARWKQPSMGNLLTANEVKKSFRLAAIVVHPDKQTGLPHAELAKAIMIELNDAWNAFEEAGSPSLT